ncbi:MAG TPA: hypothetical protein VFT31_16000, partial [Kribbella sp.]|nr:hypothetical protein [Kribbella sp.]
QEIKAFRATTSNIEQIGPIISGLGVRLSPGTAAKYSNQSGQHGLGCPSSGRQLRLDGPT